MSPISKKNSDAVNERLRSLGVGDLDLREDFIKGGGPGGQKINKTSSCVQLTYLPMGWVLRSQRSRHREDNRFFVRRLLLERLEEVALGRESARQRQIHKLRAQKRKRNRRAKEKILKQKKERAEIKKWRKRPGMD